MDGWTYWLIDLLVLTGLAVLDVQESHTVRAACTFFVSNVTNKLIYDSNKTPPPLLKRHKKTNKQGPNIKNWFMI